MCSSAFQFSFKRRIETRQVLVNFLILCLVVIQNDVNCVKSSSGNASGGGSGSKTLSNFAQSRGINGREISTGNEHGSSSSSGSHDANSDNSEHASTSSKFSSVIASPMIMTGNGGSSAFQPSYYEYQHQGAMNPTPSPLSSYLPQHLQFYSSHYPQSYAYPPESTYSARQLRYSPIPDYLSEAYGGGPLYNSLAAIEKEKDLLPSGSSYHGHGHGHGWESDTEEDHSEFGHFGHGHKKGWRKGWKKGKKHTTHTSHTDYKVSAVNTDGLGLLGLLGLLSLFQLALLALTTTTTTTAAPAGKRRKRSVTDDSSAVQDDTVVVPGSDPDSIDGISRIVLPSLNVVAHARNGRVPLNCTFQEVCRANQLIVKNVEVGGAIIGMKITDGIIEMLQFLDETPDKSLAKLLKDASFKGRMGETCEKHYPTCSALRKPGGVYSLPLLLPISHPYYYNHSQKIESSKQNKFSKSN